jgi:hypothetical protein
VAARFAAKCLMAGIRGRQHAVGPARVTPVRTGGSTDGEFGSRHRVRQSDP